MSTAWLKVIGESRHPREHYKETFIGLPKRQKPRNGDHMVLYAVGGSKNVFALVEVTSEVGQWAVGRQQSAISSQQSAWLH